MRMYSEYDSRATSHYGFPGIFSWAPHIARCTLAILTINILDAFAAFGPSYRPTAKSTLTPYLGHSFNLLRMTIDLRPQTILFSFTDSLRLLCAL